jgi:hypothetical protein
MPCFWYGGSKKSVVLRHFRGLLRACIGLSGACPTRARKNNVAPFLGNGSSFFPHTFGGEKLS